MGNNGSQPIEAIVRSTEERRETPVATILSPALESMQSVIYALALLASIAVWFLAIRAPLWLDETGSFQQISAGFSHIPSRQGLSFPAYSYILWLCTKVLGTSEIALRVPEILAMLGAVYLLYLAAQQLFDRDVAIIAAIVFCLHPITVFTAIDVRPYAFAALATNAAILALVRLRNNESYMAAAMFGFSTACIVYFHFLFAAIFPALAIGFFIMSSGDRKWRQFGVALAVFICAFLPVVPWTLNMFRSSGSHVIVEDAPKLAELGWTIAPGLWPWVLLAVAFFAAFVRKINLRAESFGWCALVCVVLGLLPIGILYGLSVETPIHVFIDRYQLVAIPGIALCWAWAISQINSRAIRMLFCVALVATTVFHNLNSPFAKIHGYTWKYALSIAEKNASADDAPVLICSDFVESDSMTMPSEPDVKDSALFAQLTYYKLSVPVVGLPRALNNEAIRVGLSFLQSAMPRHRRFLALGAEHSYRTLQWLANNTSDTYNVRELGESFGIVVLEFTPRAGLEDPR
jgi:mannosyltransferase